MKRVGLFIAFLLLLGLACNAPISDETPSPTPSATMAETDQPSQPPEETPTAESDPTKDVEITPTVVPTFTPIQVTPRATPIGTRTATPEPTETATATVTESPTSEATPTEEAESGPLSFTYSIAWEVSSNPSIAIATVTIAATGGGGDYQYFRDDLPVDGPVFQYEWATCRANPGSLRVDSADGQSRRIEYYENPPCPES